MSFLDNPYAPAPDEPVPHWTQRISDNVWPLLGAVAFITSTGLWLLFALAYFFAEGGKGYLAVPITEAVVVGVATLITAIFTDCDLYDAPRAVGLGLVVAWAHLASLALATVAISVFT